MSAIIPIVTLTPTMDLVFRSLAAGAATAALLTLAWGIVKGSGKLMWAVFGRRRSQSKLLDKLACGSSVAYVESMFGPAQFITYENEREQRIYHLPGAWVMIEILDARVIAFSVTITKRRMYYNTKRLTFGFLKVKLGKDKFGDHGVGYDGERLWIGAYRCGYLRTFYFLRSGASQRFWLSYNMSGTGVFGVNDPVNEDVPRWYNSGLYCEDPKAAQNPKLEPGLNANGTTVNTLTIMHPAAPEAEFLARNILGPDEAYVRMATSIELPADRTALEEIRFRWWRATYKTKKLRQRNNSE